MKWFWRRSLKIDSELDEELRTHIEMRAEMNRQAGMPPDEALAAAQRQFGNRTFLQEESRRMHINDFLETTLQDLCYAARGFLRSPAFTLGAIAALALGIGGATAVFSVVDRVLFRALPYPEPDRMVSIGAMTPLDTSELMFSASYLDWQRHQSVFTGLTGFGGVVDCDLTERNPAALGCAQLESNFLPTFGIRPILGRTFAAEEDVTNGPPVVLMSYGLWRRRFGADPTIAGKKISLNGVPTTILGVLPASFELPRLNAFDLVVPLRLNHTFAAGAAGRDMRAFARLKPGITVAQARAAMQPLFDTFFLPQVPPPFQKQVSLRIRPVRDLQTQDSRQASWLLLGAVGALLLIACANVANLMLARAARRNRELAVRAAIGASRARLFRQTITESLLLSASGGVAGCGLAFALIRLFSAIAPGGIPRLEDAHLDWRALLFAAAVMIFCGILFGVAPALENPRPENLTGSRTVGPRRGIFRQTLVVAQIAVSLVLVSGAVLLTRSLLNLENTPLGINEEHAVAASLVLGPARYGTGTRQQQFFEALEAKVALIPGIRAAGISDTLPPTGRVRSMPFTAIQAEGHERYTRDSGGLIDWRFITPGYFGALGIHIVRGRGFTEEDRDPSRTTVVISETLARRLFPNEDPLGRGVRFVERDPWYTVIGVASDVKNSGVTQKPDGEYYMVRRHGNDAIYSQQVPPFGWRPASIVMRSSLSTEAIANELRAAVASIDPTLPVDIKTIRDQVVRLSARPRFDAALLALFAGMGLTLAAIGLYGVIAFLVAQRTQEIGVRVAIGASPGAIASMVLAGAARWTAIGICLGIAGSLAAGRAIQSMLFGVQPTDALSFAAAATVLAAVAFAAAWLPARRAATVDPATALRTE